MLYLIKSALCLLLFYPCYMVLLSRETFHRFNRMALMGILLASMLIPVCRVTTENPMWLSTTFQRLEMWLTGNVPGDGQGAAMVSVELEPEMMGMMVEEVESTAPAPTLAELWSTHWTDALLLVYLMGILFLLVKQGLSVVRLMRLVRQSRREQTDKGYCLCLHTREDVAPFSWMKFIVMSEADYRENGEKIVAHEQAHIAHGHSWDLLLVEACILVQWFNPAVWLLRQELQNIHEYEADEAVIRQGIEAKEYQLLIIKKAVGARLYSLANSLNHSSLKKRLTMMMKKKSNPWARLKYLYVLPLAAASVVAFARPETDANKSNAVSVAKVTDFSANAQISEQKTLKNEGDTVVNEATKALVDKLPGAEVDESGHITLNGKKVKKMLVNDEEVFSAEKEDKVFMVVEKMPEFPGGMAELMKFLQQNIKYPKEAQANGVQGRVVVQFVVTKEGKITDPTIVKSVSPELDAEAIRVVNAMPLWAPGEQRGKPVDVKYTLPIQFRLQGDEAPQKQVSNKTQPVPNVRVTGTGEYLYGHDGTMREGTLEEVANYVNDVRKENDSAGNGAHFKVQMIADKGAPQESVDKLKEVLREIHVLHINFQKADDEVFMVVEKMPEFPGGMAELMKYLQQNVKYPKKAWEKKDQGRVIVQFVVTKEGKIADPTIKRSVSPELDAEAIRVVNAMPLWTPGQQKGKNVNVKFTLPIQFKLTNPKK